LNGARDLLNTFYMQRLLTRSTLRWITLSSLRGKRVEKENSLFAVTEERDVERSNDRVS
jgi:hypothetical protein